MAYSSACLLETILEILLWGRGGWLYMGLAGG